MGCTAKGKDGGQEAGFGEKLAPSAMIPHSNDLNGAPWQKLLLAERYFCCKHLPETML